MTSLAKSRLVINQGSPAEDPRAFRKCLGQFATGVTVITTACDGQLSGMSVNSFAALSLDPALVLWSIRRESASLENFRSAGHYAVNILAEDQVELANSFAKAGDEKFAQARWRAGRFGAPLLEGVIAILECRLEQVVEGGDHYILIGRVEHYEVFAGKPLLFLQGRYAAVDELASCSHEENNGEGCGSTLSLNSASLLRRFHYASHLMSASFDRKRQEMGLSVAEFRVYGWLREQDLFEEDLAACLYLGRIELRSTLEELRDRGHLAETADGKLTLTPAGRVVSLRSIEQVRLFEDQLLQGVSSKDIKVMQAVVDTIVNHAQALNSAESLLQ